jgi:hypothetical protein
MTKAKVSFKPVRIANDDWNILAECPGVESVHIRVSKANRNRRVDERRTPHRLAALSGLREVGHRVTLDSAQATGRRSLRCGQ